jgi:hypothetical protein
MLGARLPPGDSRQPPSRIVLAPPYHRLREAHDIIRIQVDQTRDHRGATRQMRQLSSQPVLGRRRVGVGGGDQAVRVSQRFEPVGRGIHAQAPRRSRARTRALQDGERKAQAPSGRACHGLGLVAAGVGDENRLEPRGADGLMRERGQARGDAVSLVASGDDHHAHGCHGAPSAMSSRPRS